MDSTEFVIPLCRDDLLNPKDNNYTVGDIYPPIELRDKLQECQQLQKEEGSVFILRTFDNLYSVLNQFTKVDYQIREDAWDIVFNGVAQHGSELCLILDDANEVDSMIKNQHVTVLKMLTYLLCQMTELFEIEATKPSAESVVNVAKGKRKQLNKESNENCSEGWDWEEQKSRCLDCLYQLCMLPLNKLFEPAVIEEEYVNLVCNCCYKLLENPAIGRMKATKDSIFKLVAIHLKKYNHSTSCSLTIIQLLRHFEHLVSPLAYGVGIFVNNFGVKNIVNDIIREIGRMDENDLARDTTETRAYSQFLVEIAQQMPNLILPTISLLLPHLNGDAYSMRNCVLEVMGEIVLKVLSDGNLEDKLKNLRNQFLDRLEDHIHDINAFVRCRALQIWNKLCAEKAIPLPRQQRIFSLIVGRLEDKSSNVRKNSMQALITFIQSNPFAAKLPLEELEKSLKREKEKLEEMQPSSEQSQSEDLWMAIESQVNQAISHQETNDDYDDSQLSEDILLTDILAQVKTHLQEKQIVEAVQLLKKAVNNWPDYELFAAKLPESQPVEEESESSRSETCEDENTGDESQKMDSDEKSEKNGSVEATEPQEQNNGLAEIVRKLCSEVNMESDLDKELVDVSKVVQQANESQNEPLIVANVAFNQVDKQLVLVRYLQDCLSFAEQVNKAIPTVCSLLGSKTNTDVLEAIQFFVTALEFGVQNALNGVRKMLLLIWSKQPGIKDAVVTAYKTLYLNPEGQNERSKALAIVTNLTHLMQDLTLGEMGSLEELIAEFMKSKDLSKQVIQVLWEKFSLKLPNTTPEESLAALQLLTMAASAEVAIVSSNVDVLIAMGLGDRAHDDFTMVKHTCKAFIKLARPIKTESKEDPIRFAENNDIFVRLADIIVDGIGKTNDKNWVPMVEQAVATIYNLAEKPDYICGDILRRLAKIGLESKSETSTNDEQGNSEESEVSSEVLSRVVFYVGQVSLYQLIHLEQNIACELKRRHFMQEEVNNQKNSKKSRPSSVNTPKNKEKGETMEEEMGLTGAVAEDAEAEFLRGICESEIVTGANLLAKIAPLIVLVCSNPTRFKCVKLTAAAVMSLAKFMLISSEFCEQHLPLLFTILEKSPQELIRANVVISLGDLSFRFPNLIEPWTPHLYSRLHDESVHVRKNTLMVLTHLILNDMVKVKGQISDIATCIVDKDPRISGLARLFFSELAEKGNSVYNVLPDIISRLSDASSCTNEENFKTIQEFLFAFIQKDRQVECLVEKLCHRFRATNTERQWRDISFCLSLLSFGEKCVKKLLENFSCFSDKLGEQTVYNCFVSILASAKKTCKIENKVLIEELEAKMEEARQKAVGENQILEKAQIAKSQNVKSEPKSPSADTSKSCRKAPKSTRKVRQSLAEKNGNMSEDEDFSIVKRKSQVMSNKKIKQITFSSDEDDNNVENHPADKSAMSNSTSLLVPNANTSIAEKNNQSINESIHHDSRPTRSTRKTKTKSNSDNTFKTPANQKLQTENVRRSSRRKKALF